MSAKRMLIDAAHPEEIRVVVVGDNGRVEEFEVESTGKEMVKGNIYVGEVTRVEPSLQAAFINYGGNRNGFLAFGEIHPDCFALPAKEKKDLLKELEEIAERRRARMEEREREYEERRNERLSQKDVAKASGSDSDDNDDFLDSDEEKALEEASSPDMEGLSPEELEEDARALALASELAQSVGDDTHKVDFTMSNIDADLNDKKGSARRPRRHERRRKGAQKAERVQEVAEAMLSSEADEMPTDAAHSADAETDSKESRTPRRASKGKTKAKDMHDDDDASVERMVPIHRRYNIEDVLKEGQKILVQVRKEERGNKGAALTTYISLPGRFTVLMPNTPYAGGISRKISDPNERVALKKIYGALKIPNGMGLIMRTAGGGHDEELIKRDFKNLTARWKQIQKDFKEKNATDMVHEDGSLIIRCVRDMFSDEIDEILVAGHRAYRTAKEYMKFLMPESVKVVKEYTDETPLFSEYKVEHELHKLHHSRVNLPSGGYLIINPTEALVAIDVNSGRNTSERNIEETAYKTNLEAAEEVARQLRMRDLAGLIVVDFIDMEDRRNERAVERAMKKAVRKDRARIQVSSISEFGLLEMSRQRLRPSMEESTYVDCPHCLGTGVRPSLMSSALMVLRNLEDDSVRQGADRVIITCHTELAIYLLNHKKELIRDLESRYKIQILVRADDTYDFPDHRLELVSLSADGKERSQTKEVKLREQPEGGPETRRRRGSNNAKRGNRRRDKDDDHDEHGHHASEGNDRSERGHDRNKRNDKNERGDKRGRGGKNHRRDHSESNAVSADNAETHESSTDAKKAGHSEKQESKSGRNRPARHTKREDGQEKEARPAKEPRSDAADKPAKAEKPAPTSVEATDKAAEKPASKGRPARKTRANGVDDAKAQADAPAAKAKPATESKTKAVEPQQKPSAEVKAEKPAPRPAPAKGIVVETISEDGNAVRTEKDKGKASGVLNRWWSR